MVAGIMPEESPSSAGRVLGNTQWGWPQGKCNRNIPPNGCYVRYGKGGKVR